MQGKTSQPATFGKKEKKMNQAIGKETLDAESRAYEKSCKSLNGYLNHREFLMSSPHRKARPSLDDTIGRRIRNKVAVDMLQLTHVAFNGKETTQSNPEDCCFSLNTNNDNIIVSSNGSANLLFFDNDGKKTKEFKTGHKEIITQVCFASAKKDSLEVGSSSCSHPMDREVFYTSSLDKTIMVWHGQNHIQTLKDHKDWIRCLTTNSNCSTLLSGCISGLIYGWDINRNHQNIFQIQNQPSTTQHGLNTINSLLFTHHSQDTFYSASRDGCVRLYDMRNCAFNSNSGVNTIKPIFRIKTHEGKMNQLQLTKNDIYLLSSGRDGCMRLFDTRKLPSSKIDNIEEIKPFVYQTYSSHQCQNYNIGSTFYDHENSVVSGSEDNKIYIYDTVSGKLQKVLSGHEGVVHMLININESRLLSNSIESSRLFFWEATTEQIEIKLQNEMEHHYERDIMEQVMRQHGDQILNFYHTNSLNNESSRLGMGISDLVASPESEQLYSQIMQTFLQTMLEQQSSNPAFMSQLEQLMGNDDDNDDEL